MSGLQCQLYDLPLGQGVSEPAEGMGRETLQRRDLALRFGLAVFFWFATIALGIAANTGYIEHFSENGRHYMPFLLLVLASPVVFYCAYPIHRRAWLGLRNLQPGADSLLSIAVLSTYFFSVVQALQGTSRVHFSSASSIVAFVLATKLVELIAKTRSSRWLQPLHQIASSQARVLAKGRECFVPTGSLNPGDVFLVKAGEHCPADGRVEAGSSQANESLLTGETNPIPKDEGDSVVAGSLILDGFLQVRAMHTGTETTLARILALLESARNNRSPLERRVDRVSAILIPGVLLFGLLTFGICWIGGLTDFDTAFMRAVTVLVIACPCALALVTPLAVNAALGAASKRGVLISDTQVLETLGRVNHVVLDKTGTMTEGRFELLGCETVVDYCSSPAWMQANSVNSELDPLPPDFPFDLVSPSYEQAFELLASLEQYSEHPLGKALVNFARERGIPIGEASCVELHPGLGVTGIVAGRSMFVGGRRLVDNMVILIDARTELVARRWESEGRTVTFFGWEGGLKGCLAFGNAPRRNASSFVAELKRRGITAHLVSGDSRATTEAIARQLGLESYHSEVLPVQKAELIRQCKRNGAVIAMVGDGISEAAALSAAHLGIAMGKGTDIPAKEASLVLPDGDLQKIPQTIDLAQKAMAVVRQSLFWVFACNIVGTALAVSGILNPINAAALILFSTLCVAGNSLCLSRAAGLHS